MKENHPEAIFIQLHTYCNATCVNCPHPFTYKTIHAKGRMSDAVWKKILKDIIEMNYTGQVGFYLHHEPPLDKTLFDKIKDINSSTNAYVVLSTNGALLDKINIEKLIEARPRKVHININSGDKEEFHRSMGLDYQTTISNIKNFISKAANLIDIEINCPVMKGYNVDSLKQIFPNTYVNLEYNANSRGGLLPELIDNVKNSRFKLGNYCKQPSQNFNILYDGSVIACCMDWMHESKNDFDNINSSSISKIYNHVKLLEEEFKEGEYKRYKMCRSCSVEMDFKQRKKINNKERLKILITNHHLLDYTGSEVYTFYLAKSLKNLGHDVLVYSKYIDKIKNEFYNQQIELVDNLELIRKKKFDVAHVHHNINAIEIRKYFPELPIVFVSHGIIPFLEQPPHIDIDIYSYVAVSEEVSIHLQKLGVLSDKIQLIHNIIDGSIFYDTQPPREIPKNVLVISGRIDDNKLDKIQKAAQYLNMNLTVVGGRFGQVNQNKIKKLIAENDIVFTLGRGVPETIFSGRIPFVYDYLGGDGLITPQLYEESKKCNFSGRRFAKDFSVDEIIDELKNYDSKSIDKLMPLAKSDFSLNSNVQKLVDIYRAASISEVKISDDTLNECKILLLSLNETREYTRSLLSRNNADNSLTVVDSLEKNPTAEKVSIIIPVFNKIELTEKCLDSIVKNTSAKYQFEVIIVNNGSTDSTVEIVSEFSAKYPNFHLINLEENLGFAKANNIASKRAKGEYLLLLNNDTEVQPGWLEAMVEYADNDSTIGAVGSKLLFPDNTIQHAGLLIYKKYTSKNESQLIAIHNHYKKSPDDPFVNIPYEYQALTAACLLIPKVLYKQLNGFDERFWNGYEDVDLCLRIRKAGYKLVYCPASTLIHHESQSGAERFSKVPENVDLLQKIWSNKKDFDFIVDPNNNLIATNTNAIIPYVTELTSIVIISFNNLKYLKETVNSIIETVKVDYELIIVDNDSDEFTKQYLKQLQKKLKNTKIIFNDNNKGFPNAVNTTIRIADGSHFVILNNDIVLTHGWLERMIAIAKMSDKVGIVGPVSNSVSGKQYIKDPGYKRKDLEEYSLEIKSKFYKQVLQFPRVAFLCTLIKREVIDKIGGLDERFSPGNFEDDDFCLRAQLAGYKTVIAKDVFIHHYGSKSFKANGEAAYAERMKINQQKFVDKWGADPNEIWLKGKKIKSRNIVYPVNNDEFIESFNRTLIHSEDNEFELALKEIQRAINTFDDSKRKGFEQISKEELLNLAGKISLQIGDFEKSKDFFELELVENPNSGRACLGLAETFYKAELFKEAKTMYEWAIKNGENKNEIWNKLNSINQKLGLPENHNSLELSRENELPTIEQAEELINKSDLINAEKILLQILHSDPNNIDALNDYAVMQIMQNNYGPALELINKVIQLDPSNEVALDNLKYIEQEVNSIN